jgi:hypothetical protein
MFGAPPEAGFLAVTEGRGEMEAYGESQARPLFSACFDTPVAHLAERARTQALAELRLDPGTPVVPVARILPPPRRVPEGFDLAPHGAGYAAAIVGACPRLGLHVNLLPPDLRATGSRMMFVPAIALGVLLAISCVALPVYSAYEDHRYLDRLRAEIGRLDPVARKPMQMDRAIETSRERTVLLDRFRKRTRDDLDALAELTRILEPPAYAAGLEINRDTVRVSGEAPQAAGLLRIMDKSPLFEGSEFSAPMSRTQTGEVFVIRSRREGLSK